MAEAKGVGFNTLDSLKPLVNTTGTGVSTHGPQLSLLDEKALLRKVVDSSEEMLVLRLSQQILLTSSTATWPSSASQRTIPCIPLIISKTKIRAMEH